MFHCYVHCSSLSPSGRSFDVELPVECDDEYWAPEDPALAFKQPEGKPAKIMFFNWGIKLNQIQSYAMRTIVRSSDLA